MERHLLDQGCPLSVQPLGRCVLPGECGSDFYRYAGTCVKDSSEGSPLIEELLKSLRPDAVEVVV